MRDKGIIAKDDLRFIKMMDEELGKLKVENRKSKVHSLPQRGNTATAQGQAQCAAALGYPHTTIRTLKGRYYHIHHHQIIHHNSP